MHQCLGSWSQELVGVVLRILNGPWHLGASFAFRWVVLTLVSFSQTHWSVVNFCDGVVGPFCFITSVATCSAAETSRCIWSRALSQSLTAGSQEVKFTKGMNSGWKPYQTWNGDCPIALCARMLWANLVNRSRSAQLSYWKLQKTQKNCSISWFMCLVLPSVCGWKAVEREDLMPSFSHSSCITFKMNCGPLSDMTCCSRPVLH